MYLALLGAFRKRGAERATLAGVGFCYTTINFDYTPLI